VQGLGKSAAISLTADFVLGELNLLHQRGVRKIGIAGGAQRRSAGAEGGDGLEAGGRVKGEGLLDEWIAGLLEHQIGAAED
jgi:hypothetical protein